MLAKSLYKKKKRICPSSEKQRKWACAQTGTSRKKFKGKPSLTAKEAAEMCRSKVEEEELDEMSSMAGGSVAGYAGNPPRKKKNKKNEGMVEQIIDYLLNTNKLETSQ